MLRKTPSSSLDRSGTLVAVSPVYSSPHTAIGHSPCSDPSGSNWGCALVCLEFIMQESLEFLLHAHYHLMDNPRFWYDKGLIQASALLCRAASDLRQELRKE